MKGLHKVPFYKFAVYGIVIYVIRFAYDNFIFFDDDVFNGLVLFLTTALFYLLIFIKSRSSFGLKLTQLAVVIMSERVLSFMIKSFSYGFLYDIIKGELVLVVLSFIIGIVLLIVIEAIVIH